MVAGGELLKAEFDITMEKVSSPNVIKMTLEGTYCEIAVILKKLAEISDVVIQ